MAIGVLILGQSGTGKSYSMKNFNEDEVKVISIEKPILPFKKKLDVSRLSDVDQIIKEMKTTKKKSIVIDDFQYLLGVPTMRRSLEKGWDKFSEMQYDYFKVLDAVKELPDDVIVYFLSHTETDEDGSTKIKTIGKALDKYITIEGLFMIVLKTVVSDNKYAFVTQNNGKDTVKSPDGMFSTYAINNDLKYVDEKIRNYYEIGENFLTDEEIAEIDETAKNLEIEPPKPKEERKRRSRNSDASSKQANDDKPPVQERKQRKTREEVESDNGVSIANANTNESGEPIPFEESETPEIEQPPRRRRRRTE